MTRGKPVAASVAIVSLMLVLSGCTASYSQRDSAASSSISITSTGAALTATAEREEPSLGKTSKANDTAAFVAYWKRQGYAITANRQTLKPDGTVKTFHFAALRRRRGNDAAGTIAVTITDAPPPDTGSQKAAAKAAVIKAPPLTDMSTAKEIAAYAAFYERHGYKITLNQQTYYLDGTVQEFHFVAKRHGRGANQPSISANIDGATHNISIEEVRNGTSNP